MARKIARDEKDIPEGSSLCVTCKDLKENKSFHWYKSDSGKPRTRVNGSCRECRCKLAKETRELKKKIIPYSPKPSERELCEACGRQVYKNQSDIPKGVDGTYSWNFDHEHGTENFRGWICTPCNTGFGLLGDTYESILKRLEFLKKAKTNQNNSQKKYFEEVKEYDIFYIFNSYDGHKRKEIDNGSK